MTKLESTPAEKKISRSNTRKTWKNKLKMLGYAGMISTVFMACGNDYESKHTKLSKQHDADVENITTKKEEMKDLKAQDSLIHVDMVNKQKEINEAIEKEKTSNIELKKAEISSKEEKEEK